MDERQLAQLLDDIAKQEIPDDMNLWNDIQAQIEKPTPSRARPALRLSKLLLIAAILLLVSSAYAVYQVVNPGGDAGIVSVSELITPLEITQSHPDYDINVTLQWAYADGHRIAVGWQVDFAENLLTSFPTAIKLYDVDGKVFGPADFLYGGGGGGGGGGGRVMFGSTTSFDATHITGNPESLDLKMVMDFSQEYPLTELDPIVEGSGGGGGGGGGGSETTGTPEPTPTPIEKINVEPFTMTFEFSVPFIPAVKVIDTQSSEASGVTMTLKDVSYAPSATLGTLCYTHPEGDEAYQPAYTLKIDGIPASDGGFYINDPALLEADPICGDLVLLGGVESTSDYVTLTIDRLQTDPKITPEKVEQFKTEMKAAGFEVDVQKLLPDELAPMKASDRESGAQASFYFTGDSASDPLYYFGITKIPEDLQNSDYYPVIVGIQDRIFRKTIEGPWSFEIRLK